MIPDNRPNYKNRPIWFLNMLSVFNWNLHPVGIWGINAEGNRGIIGCTPTPPMEVYLDLLLYWAPSINTFLDGTMIKGNSNAQSVVDVCYRLFLRYADWMQLTITDKDSKYIHTLQATFKRLDGITTRPKPKRKKVNNNERSK